MPRSVHWQCALTHTLLKFSQYSIPLYAAEVSDYKQNLLTKASELEVIVSTPPPSFLPGVNFLMKLLSRVWLCSPVNCSLPGSSIHGILQARILERVAIPFSRGSSRPRDRTQVSLTAGRCFNLWAIPESICIPFPVLFILIVRWSRNSRATSAGPWGFVSANLHSSLDGFRVCSPGCTVQAEGSWQGGPGYNWGPF